MSDPASEDRLRYLIGEYLKLSAQIGDMGWLDKHTAEERYYPLLGQIAEVAASMFGKQDE